ncbi:MAG: hypothetical protein KFH98_13965 [Gemmatimonadetes bacterium]|nr:hypothetical protein [Gemmatimonadota bacterium]
MTHAAVPIGLCILLAGCAPPAAPVLPLVPDDFTLRGVPVDADSTEIRFTFGDPDSIAESDNPFEDDAPLVTWMYDGFEVRFGGEGMPLGYMIVAPGEQTARGVAVGDAAQQALELYGEPTMRFPPGWTWADTTDGTALRIIDVVVQADTISRIYIGRAHE